MTILFCDGMNHYGSRDRIPDKWDVVTTPVALSWQNTNPAAPYDSKYYISMLGGSNANYIQKTITPAIMRDSTDRANGYITVISAGFRCYVSGTPAAETVLMSEWLDSTKKVELRYTSEGRIKFYIGDTLIATSSTGVFQFNVWQHIELSLSGTWACYVNGISAMTGSETPASAGINAVRIYHPALNMVMNISDFFISKSGKVGTVRINQYLPDAAGTYSQFTPSAGANHECVDDAALNTADYISGTGSVDTYNFEDIVPAAGIGYFGVQITAHVKKTNKGDCKAALVSLVNSTVYPTAEQLSGDYAYRVHDLTDTEKYLTVFLEKNPDTEQAFIYTDINSSQFGIRLVA